MCGRYEFSVDEIAELEKIVDEVNRKFNVTVKTGEIYPTDLMALIANVNNEVQPAAMVWGFPAFKGGRPIINARAETVLEKPLFAKSVLERRCIVPSSGFFEWQTHPDKTKTKYKFNLPDSPVLYMAGIFNNFSGENRFTIITTEANEYIKDVHTRMPVVLTEEEKNHWLDDKINFDNYFDRSKIKLVKQVV